MDATDRLLVELRLANYRTNRRTCPPGQRAAFDALIRHAEAILAARPAPPAASRR